MNTPKDEMITAAIHCMVEQRKHEIWEVLYPLSIKYGFTLDSVYSAFVKGDFLYVMCRGKVYFILDLESGVWRIYLPMHRPPRLKVLWWNIQETVKDLVWFARHWKGLK